ncbi:MAG: bifunctional 2-polyprenyl-6-hydroxyphenol methylase/3-demethylubiquinol 3-O-methyltransferase UbiG, partial [Proteobacteria bacterium]|nr:bifunctional 2-polyprenyl-6-hydroxyphenol methylase/3-demethylubiquinol 3-O-methyltransferase UbiG [Pseudomonadota bacterium]
MNNFDQNELDKFSKLADEWWDPNGKFKPLHLINPLRSEYISKKINLEGLAVLDIGCGGGILAESLTKKGANVTAIDLANGPLNVAKLRAQKTKLNINYQKISSSDLAETGKKYDVITCLEMLEHVPDPSKIVADCQKLLKNDGHVFFSTINRNIKSLMLAIFGAEYILNILPRGTHEYEKLIKPSELKNYIDVANLEFKEIKGMLYLP